ncbi:hypothetical protein [Pseudomonas nunensis]|uniref:Uncharacterized protein n=1 Tax=Pseudomonas nunensis TaxID=2961896 RepID=A0ABY5EK71_9PSED|nr:hypothetical protein [Pseudomonas nunensis]KPN94146.1 hypothetical protein AL066_04660 [Pseudomonas nunensis]MCL5230673.1 hypothetical protein [Pseudomonas nunensis]UTO15686.1 hypothetical protein NK667_04790 [Pseudomonas nunensis]
MISFNIATGHILFQLPWQNKKRCREMELPRPPLASETSLMSICNETILICQRFANLTKAHRINALKRILDFANAEGKGLPELGSSEWRVFVSEHYIYHLSHPEKFNKKGDKKLETIRTEWRQVLLLYKNLKQRHIIPLDIVIPTMKQPIIPDDETSADVLDSVEESLWPLTNVDDLWPKTYLVDKSLNISTDKFLDKLQSDLETRTQTIVLACEGYWDNVVICHRIGESLINSISVEKIEAVLASGDFYINHRYIADAQNPDGAAWFLAMIEHFFLRTGELDAISYKAMEKIPFFQPFCTNSYMQARMVKELRKIAGDYGAPTQTINETLNRLLGYLSARDCGAAAAILAAENPKFNPHALRTADYLSGNDKPIHYYNSALGRLMWSVSKPRAISRKVSALPPRSHKIYVELVKATMKARIRLMLAGDINYRKMFLTSTYEWVGLSSSLDQIFTTKLGVSLYQALEKELTTGDISRKIFTLKRIRGTQALISFLKEGTYQAAANTLGNSIAVIIVRYIPKWLKQRWNVRILRTFQTKLIVLATKGKPWHLAASDFLTENDLFNFIIREAAVSVASDPISIDLKRYAAELTEDAVHHLIERLVNHKVILKLDAASLAAIFLFSEIRISPRIKQFEDVTSGITEESITTLARLLHCAYDISKDPSANGTIIGNIAGLSVPYFQAVYVEALELKSKLAKKIVKVDALINELKSCQK